MDIKEVYKVKEVKEVLEILNEYKGSCKVIAGGTDLIIDLRHNTLMPDRLIDISNMEELKNISVGEDYIEIGAGVTFSDIEESSLFNQSLLGLKEAAASIGSPQIRNRATVGGNICNGSPAADIVPPLAALGAKALIKSAAGERGIALEELYIDKGKVDIGPEELLTGVRFKKIDKRESLGFGKLGLRKALAISRICLGVYLKVDEEENCREVRVASGAIGKHVMREREVEDFLRGKYIDDYTLKGAAEVFENQIKLRLSGRSTVEFKSQASKEILKEALKKAYSQILNEKSNI